VENMVVTRQGASVAYDFTCYVKYSVRVVLKT